MKYLVNFQIQMDGKAEAIDQARQYNSSNTNTYRNH